MKTIEELKQEQFDAKTKLHELVEFINSEEFYSLSQSEKNIIGQRRIALEMYLNSLTKDLYDKEGSTFDTSNAVWPLLMSSMFTGSSFGPSSSIDSLKKQIEDDDSKADTDTDNEKIYMIPE